MTQWGARHHLFQRSWPPGWDSRRRPWFLGWGAGRSQSKTNWHRSPRQGAEGTDITQAAAQDMAGSKGGEGIQGWGATGPPWGSDSIWNTPEPGLGQNYQEMGKEGWRAAVHGVTEGWTQQSDWTTTITSTRFSELLLRLLSLKK